MRSKTLDRIERTHTARNGFIPVACTPTTLPLSPKRAQQVATTLGLPAPTDIGHGFFFCVHDVQPAQALNWLQNHNQNNRDETYSHMLRMSRDMENDGWATTHQSIAFDENANYIDGQNRSGAIVLSGKIVRCVIAIYQGRSSAHGIDVVKVRDFADYSTFEGSDLGKLYQSVLRLLYQGSAGIKGSSTIKELMEASVVYGEAIHWSLEHMTSRVKGVARASVWAAIARAYYHVPRAKLERFCEVLSSGMGDKSRPEDETISTLLRYLASMAGKPSGADRVEVYSKCINAIQNYVSGKVITKMYCAQPDVYPLPEVKPAQESMFA